MSPATPPACEVLDAKNRPLCLLDYDSVLEQGLRHRGLAVLLKAGGEFILRQTGNGFGFFHFSFLPAGVAGEEAALDLAGPRLAGSAPKFVGIAAPCAEIRNALLHLYQMEIPRLAALGLAADTRNWLPITPLELGALAEDDLIHPYLRHALRLGHFKK